MVFAFGCSLLQDELEKLTGSLFAFSPYMGCLYIDCIAVIFLGKPSRLKI